MYQNHIKFHAINEVSPRNADSNKPTKIDVINYVTNLFFKEDQNIYSRGHVEVEVERLISTGQILIKPKGLAILGQCIFEEAQEVSPDAHELSKLKLEQQLILKSQIKTVKI